MARKVGSIWVEGQDFHWLTSADVERKTTTSLVGTPGGAKIGSSWPEGTYLHLIDASGDERRIQGTFVKAATGAKIGSMWVESNSLCYVDASGDKRSIAGSELTPQYSHPASDYDDGAWTDIPYDSYLWDNVDEHTPDDDSSYIMPAGGALFRGSSDTCRFNMETLSDPGIDGPNLCYLKVRHKLMAAVGTNQVDYEVKLICVASTIFTWTFYTTDDGAWHTETRWLTQAEMAAIGGNWGSLDVQVKATANSGNDAEEIEARVTWIEFKAPAA